MSEHRTDEQPIEQILQNVANIGGQVQLNSSTHNDVAGWEVTMKHEPGHPPSEEDLEEVPEFLRQLMAERTVKTDPDNAEDNHVIGIRTWGKDLDQTIRRCAESYFAAHATSLTYSD